MTFTFRVPGPPPYVLSPNAHRATHWSKKAKAKKQMQHDWHWAIVDALPRAGIVAAPDGPLFTGPTLCEVVYGKPKGGQSWDDVNLLATLKAGIDQLQRLRVIDNDKNLRTVLVDQVRDPDGVGYVEITLTGMESAA